MKWKSAWCVSLWKEEWPDCSDMSVNKQNMCGKVTRENPSLFQVPNQKGADAQNFGFVWKNWRQQFLGKDIFNEICLLGGQSLRVLAEFWIFLESGIFFTNWWKYDIIWFNLITKCYFNRFFIEKKNTAYIHQIMPTNIDPPCMTSIYFNYYCYFVIFRYLDHCT